MSTVAPEFIKVEVVYATAERQFLVEIEVETGTTAGDAIEKSGILERNPEIDLLKSGVGIFGKPCDLDYVLKPRDRVEIYRPLRADPKEVRRRLAAEGKTMGKKGNQSPVN